MIDITRPIHPDMAIYPGNPEVAIRPIREAQGTTSALSEISLGSHTGTHMDTLLHIDPAGSGPEAYGLERCIGPSEVVAVADSCAVITGSDLPTTSRERVLIKTKNSQKDIDVFDEDFAALDESAAEELIRRGVRLVGIDGPSIKKRGVADRVHELLLRADILVIEGMYLREATPGPYMLVCLPLSVSRIDGVPVRAILASNGEIDY